MLCNLGGQAQPLHISLFYQSLLIDLIYIKTPCIVKDGQMVCIDETIYLNITLAV